jgi:hypothetical protein
MLKVQLKKPIKLVSAPNPVSGEEYKLAPLQPASAKPGYGQMEVLAFAVLLFESVTGRFYFSGP